MHLFLLNPSHLTLNTPYRKSWIASAKNLAMTLKPLQLAVIMCYPSNKDYGISLIKQHPDDCCRHIAG